ncbi:MAG TPA: carbohydrate ABC transporter permease [Euzebyales bacterium]|nr:carbohydrate ABC transporter permease [Euzebyales bacterium]
MTSSSEAATARAGAGAVSGPAVATTASPRGRSRWTNRAIQAFLALTALVWLAPLLYTLYTSLRPYSDTAVRGYVSLPGTLNFDNYVAAWTQADMLQFFWNTIIVTVPAVVLTLLLSSMVAFVVARFSFVTNLTLLIVFTAGNLLPQQVIITPLYRMFLLIPLPEFLSDSRVLFDSYLGIIVIHVAFQMGFCVFVLSNYMKTLPRELTEAALVDGTSAWAMFWRIVMPLSRPPLAALATLQFTWIYNDFFWALVLMQSGDKRPITSAIGSLGGLYFTDHNLIAAGALLAAIPTLVVFLLLQKQFVRGLTLGSTKG